MEHNHDSVSAKSDLPVAAASNRGNKLRHGAKFVHEGSLIHVTGPEVYKQKIEHAGYTRYILDRNPRRYNEYGEELDDSETDEEADADAADQNAYSGIRLEELLCPLKHPSELPVHPTMSPAYLSRALPDMVSSTHEKLRQERANLWRAKYLNRQLTGDASWIPAGALESPDDWELFEPRNQRVHRQSLGKRKRQEKENHGQNGKPHQHSEAQAESNDAGKQIAKLGDNDLPAQKNGAGAANVEKGKGGVTDNQATNPETTEGEQVAHAAADVATGSMDARAEDAGMEKDIGQPAKPELNGIDPTPTNHIGMDEEMPHKARPPNPQKEADVQPESKADPLPADLAAAGAASHAASDADDASPPPPPPPPRRITRALAANNSTSHSNAPTPPLSPASTSSTTTTTTSSDLQIDPLYLIPPSSKPSTNINGLPPEEALETRRLLTLYIQKQEETVRGYESILSKLLTAQRLRNEVLEMCKAEEHVGELSDGEDWIDAERWGLQPGELRKGRDEDEDVLVGEGQGDGNGMGHIGGVGVGEEGKEEGAELASPSAFVSIFGDGKSSFLLN
ncbi:hypothetical protein GJ744_000495 [Endocarpon pusillum]|uniref:Transcriptional regulatory protein RXT2 N-terminal domain-containing protein n=1 Tax=Endocarpon pusillum TaxID=364733 RepID=A0A8H7ADX1_9EURO|nr:hypothetical protein GJ744_000495 [Endocarpon pusillum]